MPAPRHVSRRLRKYSRRSKTGRFRSRQKSKKSKYGKPRRTLYRSSKVDVKSAKMEMMAHTLGSTEGGGTSLSYLLDRPESIPVNKDDEFEKDMKLWFEEVFQPARAKLASDVHNLESAMGTGETLLRERAQTSTDTFYDIMSQRARDMDTQNFREHFFGDANAHPSRYIELKFYLENGEFEKFVDRFSNREKNMSRQRAEEIVSAVHNSS